MLNNLKISTLSGKVYVFNGICENTNIRDFKHKIYNQHPDISKPVSIENIDKLQIDLIYNGIKLEDTILLGDLDLEFNKDFLISINLFTKSMSIPMNKRKTLLNNYKLSPCAISEDEDIFMDSMEWRENTNRDKEIFLKKIFNKINTISDQLTEIQQELVTFK